MRLRKKVPRVIPAILMKHYSLYCEILAVQKRFLTNEVTHLTVYPLGAPSASPCAHELLPGQSATGHIHEASDEHDRIYALILIWIILSP